MFCALLGLLTAVLPAQPGVASEEPAKEVVIAGKVLPLAKALKKPDADPAGAVLVTEKGAIHVLVNDDTSRLLFLDPRLQDRPVQLTGRQTAGSQLFQVTAVHTLKDGKLHQVYYWCDNCQLAAGEPGPCKCCGGETVLVEFPVKAK